MECSNCASLGTELANAQSTLRISLATSARRLRQIHALQAQQTRNESVQTVATAAEFDAVKPGSICGTDEYYSVQAAQLKRELEAKLEKIPLESLIRMPTPQRASPLIRRTPTPTALPSTSASTSATVPRTPTPTSASSDTTLVDFLSNVAHVPTSYASTLAKEFITVDILARVTRDELRGLGVPLGHAIRISDAAATLDAAKADAAPVEAAAARSGRSRARRPAARSLRFSLSPSPSPGPPSDATAELEALRTTRSTLGDSTDSMTLAEESVQSAPAKGQPASLLASHFSLFPDNSLSSATAPAAPLSFQELCMQRRAAVDEDDYYDNDQYYPGEC
uniref:SAM domain-containing protein n=1 Tax=Sexangularia sp. CB-2014 TaxID=1486929 RepID=A0A6U0K1F1_9EUKA